MTKGNPHHFLKALDIIIQTLVVYDWYVLSVDLRTYKEVSFMRIFIFDNESDILVQAPEFMGANTNCVFHILQEVGAESQITHTPSTLVSMKLVLNKD